MRPPLMLAFAWLVLGVTVAVAGEAQLSRDLERAVPEAQVVWLEASGGRFLALHAKPPVPSAKGAVILLHGLGGHADWRDVIRPLRTSLPGAGWHTLSLQLPVPEKDLPVERQTTLTGDAVARLEASRAYLQGQEIENVAVVAYGGGAAAGTLFLAAGDPDAFTGFVAVSPVFAPAGVDESTALELRMKIEVPVLEVYASADRRGVRESVEAHALARRAAPDTVYRRVALEGAGHDYLGFDDELVKRVRGWLDRYVAGARESAQTGREP